MKKTALNFNILIEKEEDLFIAHCLELDIVATAETMDQVKKDIIDLMAAQVEYAFSNDNLENLYHPAPPEIWKEFFDCEKQEQNRRKIKSEPPSFAPPEITASTCYSLGQYHA